MALKKNLILRSPRRGRLEGRAAPIQSKLTHSLGRHSPASAPGFTRPELFDRGLGGKPFCLRFGDQPRQFGAAL